MTEKKTGNIIEFPKKSNKNQNTDWLAELSYDLNNLTISFDENGDVLNWDSEAFWDNLPQFGNESQLDELAELCFELQILVADNPESAQFIIKNMKKITENMKKRLTKS